MENKEQYYTPEISELFAGYECEVRYILYSNSNKDDIIWHNWESIIIFPEIFCQQVEMELRTKYLDKEDIESLGWDNAVSKNWFYKDYPNLTTSDNEYFINGVFSTYGCYELNYNFETNKLLISNSNRDYIFDGECKSINEFRKIMQWLKI